MTRSSLAAWLLSLQLINGNPRPVDVVVAIADVAIASATHRFTSEWIDLVGVDENEARATAALLDVFGSLESGYNINAAGDCPGLEPGDRTCTRERGARSCGVFQTPCGVTPPDARGQAELAAKLFRISGEKCPRHPLSLYARGACVEWRNGEWRQRLMERGRLVPTPGEADRDVDGAVTVEDLVP